MADAFLRGDDGDWTYLGEAVINPCQVPGCDEPSTWTFEASGPAEAFEVVVGCLVEPGDKLRLCDPHTDALRAEVEARPDGRVNAWPEKS